jgi:hypothetical protein
MSKRKKKRRKEKAIRVFGLKGVAQYYENAPLYQSRFQESDLIWLANEYERRSSHDPSLTLEDFSSQYGVSADELRVYTSDMSRDVGYTITLWHGTTKTRAKSILKEGFRAKRGKAERRIFFATHTKIPRSVAERKANIEDDEPALLMCSIDLSHYSDYEKRGRDIYVFKHNYIGSEVVKRVDKAPDRLPNKSWKWKEPKPEIVDVALTFNSGYAAIAYWINSYLNLYGDDRIDEDHESVAEIKRWFDEQLDMGRFGEVPNEELPDQVQKNLPQYFE